MKAHWTALMLGSALCATAFNVANADPVADAMPVFDTNEQQVDLGYVPTHNWSANSCEFYVNAFGDGNESLYHAVGSQLYETFLSVNEPDLVDRQRGKILAIGQFAMFSEQSASAPTPVDRKAIYLAQAMEREPAYYRIDFRYKIHQMDREITRNLYEFAYFVDVKRANGDIDRLWLTNGSRNFTPGEVLNGYPLSGWVSHGPGLRSARYVDNNSYSPIFSTRKRCR